MLECRTSDRRSTAIVDDEDVAGDRLRTDGRQCPFQVVVGVMYRD
jgi:hypothetical protein